ncbi:cys-loop ligand-gated ion channel [Hydra vulgaris]|uniref:Cys-loop ligand-gated ion channel n=1 Tax=Hydra vulgaris TaxID=6087 RepID=A0ABM4D6M5_HYDVU
MSFDCLSNDTKPLDAYHQTVEDCCKHTKAIRYEVSTCHSIEDKLVYVKRKDPVEIDLRIFIYSIENINTLRQEMLCEFLLSANWFENMPWLNNTVENEICWSKMWDPRLYFPNAIELKSSLNKTVVFVDNKRKRSMIQWSYRVKGRFKCLFDITKFPFDEQLLSINVSSYWNDTIVKFRQETSIGNSIINALHNFTDCGQWELQKYILSDVVDPKNTSSSSEMKEPLFQFFVHARRKYKYYLWNIVAMVNMISILAFTCFAIDKQDNGKRLSVSLTLLLTVVAFKNFVSSILPKVSYLTLLDKYVLINVGFIFLVSISNAVIGKLDRPEYDFAFMFVLIGLYTLFQSIFLFMSLKAVKVSREKFNERYIGEFGLKNVIKKATEIFKLPICSIDDGRINPFSDNRTPMTPSISLRLPKFVASRKQSFIESTHYIKGENDCLLDSPPLLSHFEDKLFMESDSDLEQEEDHLDIGGSMAC